MEEDSCSVFVQVGEFGWPLNRTVAVKRESTNEAVGVVERRTDCERETGNGMDPVAVWARDQRSISGEQSQYSHYWSRADSHQSQKRLDLHGNI